VRGRIFVSYRRDSPPYQLDAVMQALRQRFGDNRVFLDKNSIKAGSDWMEVLGVELAQSPAMVLLFNKQWLGEKPAGPNDAKGFRILDEGDMVAKETQLALDHKRFILPIIVDGSPPPRKEDLPPTVQALVRRQFMPIRFNGEVAVNKDLVLMCEAIERALPGGIRSWRFLQQSVWIALLCTVLVVAWHVAGQGSSFQNAFARNALTLRQNLPHFMLAQIVNPAGMTSPPGSKAAPPASASTVAQDRGNAQVPHKTGLANLQPKVPPNLALIDINEAEFETLFGGRLPLDPQQMELIVNALTNAAKQAKRCGDRYPVGIHLDLAPSVQQWSDSRSEIQGLVKALADLSVCRPVVLACPRRVVRQIDYANDQAWMNEVIKKSQEASGRGILFTHADLDPTGLRHVKSRTELGVVLADLAGGKTVRDMAADDERDCSCPLTRRELRECKKKYTGLLQWDADDQAVPFPGKALSLVAGLQHLDQVAEQEIVLIGGEFGSSTRHAVPGRNNGAGDGVSSTLAQAYMFNGTHHHKPAQGRWWMELLAWLGSLTLTAALLALGHKIHLAEERYALRLPAYVGTALLAVGTPFALLLWAAIEPAYMWLAAVLAVLAVVTAGRAMLAVLEIIVRQGFTWRGPWHLWTQVANSIDPASSRWRLAAFACEAALLVSGLLVMLSHAD
jgi:hypothetical protein